MVEKYKFMIGYGYLNEFFEPIGLWRFSADKTYDFKYKKGEKKFIYYGDLDIFFRFHNIAKIMDVETGVVQYNFYENGVLQYEEIPLFFSEEEMEKMYELTGI